MFRKLLLIPVLMLGLTACGSAPQTATRLTLTATEYSYSPAQFIVPLGDTVTLVFQNNGLLEHDFVIEKIALTNTTAESTSSSGMSHDMTGMDFDLHVSVTSGQSTTLEFTPSQAGTYVFFCTVPGHKEAGMIGQMTVIASQ